MKLIVRAVLCFGFDPLWRCLIRLRVSCKQIRKFEIFSSKRVPAYPHSIIVLTGARPIWSWPFHWIKTSHCDVFPRNFISLSMAVFEKEYKKRKAYLDDTQPLYCTFLNVQNIHGHIVSCFLYIKGPVLIYYSYSKAHINDPLSLINHFIHHWTKSYFFTGLSLGANIPKPTVTKPLGS